MEVVNFPLKHTWDGSKLPLTRLLRWLLSVSSPSASLFTRWFSLNLVILISLEDLCKIYAPLLRFSIFKCKYFSAWFNHISSYYVWFQISIWIYRYHAETWPMNKTDNCRSNCYNMLICIHTWYLSVTPVTPWV